MDDARPWLHWPPDEIREYGMGAANDGGLSATEAESLIRGLFLEAGLGRDGSALPRSRPSWKEQRAWRRQRKHARRRHAKLFAKDPIKALYVESQSLAVDLRRAAGFLDYSRDDGSLGWVLPANRHDADRAIGLVIEAAHGLRVAQKRGNIADQLRLAHKLGSLMVSAEYVVHRKPLIERARTGRALGGKNSRRHSDAERQACYFKHLAEIGKPTFAAEYAAAELGVSPRTIANAFGGKLPREQG